MSVTERESGVEGVACDFYDTNSLKATQELIGHLLGLMGQHFPWDHHGELNEFRSRLKRLQFGSDHKLNCQECKHMRSPEL